MISYIGTLFKVQFIQDFSLFRTWLRQVLLYLLYILWYYLPCQSMMHHYTSTLYNH